MNLNHRQICTVDIVTNLGNKLLKRTKPFKTLWLWFVPSLSPGMAVNSSNRFCSAVHVHDSNSVHVHPQQYSGRGVFFPFGWCTASLGSVLVKTACDSCCWKAMVTVFKKMLCLVDVGAVFKKASQPYTCWDCICIYLLKTRWAAAVIREHQRQQHRDLNKTTFELRKIQCLISAQNPSHLISLNGKT